MCRSLQNVKKLIQYKMLFKSILYCFKKSKKMKKVILSAVIMAYVLVSCNQKNKEATTDHSNMMSNDSTMMENDSTMMSNDSTVMNDKTKMMNNQTKMYACPMHPEVQGKLNDKCSKCGMKLTEPVPEKTEESK
ncbi:MAG: hypothetical protein C0430_11270 [Flavobacterium sp.]|nr:hypothetical protein [Flavobacterium sp.]